MAEGWRRRAADEVVAVPLSDGGSGLLGALHASLGGDLVGLTAPGPLGRPVPATVLVISGGAGLGERAGRTAVIEIGQVTGPHLVADDERGRAALRGTSEGVGHLLRAALSTGAGRVVVGAGLSAVHDGGAGLLRALGLPGARLGGGAAALADVAEDDLAGLREVRAAMAGRDVVVACATEESLVGLHGVGAALVQRASLRPAEAQDADRAVGRFADLVARGPEVRRALPMAGAPATGRRGAAGSRPYTGAGGVGFVLEALGGRLLAGPAVVAGLVGLEHHLDGSALALTGCTTLDAGALHAGVVAAAGAAGLRRGAPVVAIAREVQASRRQLGAVGVVGSYSLVPAPGPFPRTPAAAEPGDEAEVLADRTARVAGTWTRS